MKSIKWEWWKHSTAGMAWQTFGDNAQHLEHISVRACQGESKREKEEGEVVEKPSVNVNYKKNMGGVDTADQYIATYCFLWRTLKWQKLFFCGMEVSIINTYILYTESCQKNNCNPMSPTKFRWQLAMALVGDFHQGGDASTRGQHFTSD